jgi:hypothetical protein
LIDILVDNSPQEAAVLFRDAAEPYRFSAVLFRQATAEYLRLQPGYIVQESWRQRMRMVFAAIAFARGRGAIPRLHESYPESHFEQVESRRLGHLEEALQEPFVRYFEATAVSKQYAMAGRTGWSLIEKYRALALAYPVALWTLRYFCGDEAPSVQRVIDTVTALDRGQGFGPLSGRQHRRRVAQLTRLDALDRLVIWYAR